MRLCVIMEDIPFAALPTPKNTPSDQKLVRFHLSLPMRYTGSAPYFCMTTKTVANLANDSIDKCDVSGKHPLE